MPIRAAPMRWRASSAVTAVAAGIEIEQECDVLSPCALGGTLDAVTIPRLRCRAVVGAANNQLDGPGADRELAARGILYAPDFVANAGGIINIAEEFTGYDRERARSCAPRVSPPQRRACSRCAGTRDHDHTLAERLAHERIEREGSARRWEPGDPAAWTNGEPLRALRGTVRG